MQELTNYSGYDRDTEKYLPGFEPADVEKVEDNSKASEEIKKDSFLSPPAQEIHDWLKSNRPQQWVKYSTVERDQVFINYCRRRGFTSTEQMIDDLFSELLLAELIDIDEVENQIYVL